MNSTIACSLLEFNLTDHTIREPIAKHRPAPGTQISSSKDLPFSSAAKRALAYGAEEADRLGQRTVGAMSLLLGLARDHSCLAARILSEAGLTDAKVRELAGDEAKTAAAPRQHPAQDSEGFRDLTQPAIAGNLTPLSGRGACPCGAEARACPRLFRPH